MSPIALPSTLLALLQGDASPWLGMVPMILIFGIFYVLLILPMRKQQKALEATIANLKKGDRVITKGGLYGEVAALEDATVLLRIADNVKVKVAKSAIAGLEAESSDKGSNK